VNDVSWIEGEEWANLADNKTLTNSMLKTGNIESDKVSELVASKIYKGINALKALSSIEITQQKAEYLTGKQLKKYPNSKFYLVRGVFSNNGGQFYLNWYKDTLIVRHGGLGKQKKVYKSPLIVQLEKIPQKVIVYW